MLRRREKKNTLCAAPCNKGPRTKRVNGPGKGTPEYAARFLNEPLATGGTAKLRVPGTPIHT